MEDPAPPISFHPASTVVIFRKARSGGAPELLMVERATTMRFAAGAAVFPGGRVDEADRQLARRLAPASDPEDTAARIAGIRETLEETGLAIATARPVSADEAKEARALLLATGSLEPVLAHFGWTLDLERLTPFARWCPNRDGAFDARFYVTDLGTGAVEIEVDATENSRLHWLTADEALRRADSGELRIIFPTRRNLERLAQFGAVAEVLAHARGTPVTKIVPTLETREGETWLVIPEGLGYPVVAETLATVRRGFES